MQNVYSYNNTSMRQSNHDSLFICWKLCWCSLSIVLYNIFFYEVIFISVVREWQKWHDANDMSII